MRVVFDFVLVLPQVVDGRVKVISVTPSLSGFLKIVSPIWRVFFLQLAITTSVWSIIRITFSAKAAKFLCTSALLPYKQMVICWPSVQLMTSVLGPYRTLFIITLIFGLLCNTILFFYSSFPMNEKQCVTKTLYYKKSYL